MVASLPWRQQASDLKGKIFDSFDSDCEIPCSKRIFRNLTNSFLYYTYFCNTSVEIIICSIFQIFLEYRQKDTFQNKSSILSNDFVSWMIDSSVLTYGSAKCHLK